MNMDEALAGYKAAENKEVALLVMEDANLRRLLAVWPMVAIEGGEAPVGAGWDDLWRSVRFDEAAVADLSGISLGVCRVLLKRAVGLRLIYPDGSLHGLAKMALQSRIKSALQG